MDDMNALERQVARDAVRDVGPVRPVDDLAIFTAITATQSPKWRFPSMFSATKFVVAGVIVVLFASFLVTGLISTRQDDADPAILSPTSEPYVLPSEIPEDFASGLLETPVGPARWARVTGSPANPALMASVATEDGFAVMDHWQNRLWHSPDLLSWTELTMPADAESASLAGSAGSYWLTAHADDAVAMWRSDDLEEWEAVDVGALSPGGPPGLFRPDRFGRPEEVGGDTLVPVYYSLDLIAYLGLPTEPDGERYFIDGGGGWVFERIEPGVYRVLTTSSDIDTMPVIRLEEAPEGLRVTDAVDGNTLRELPGIDQESMEALLAAFAEKVTGRTQDQRRHARLREWAMQRGIAVSQLAILDGDRLVSLDATPHPDASREVYQVPTSVETGGIAEVLGGTRLGGMVASLVVDDGVAETLRLHPPDAGRIEIDLRPLGISSTSDDGEDVGFGRVISDKSVALSFGSPPHRGVGDYWIVSFDEIGE